MIAKLALGFKPNKTKNLKQGTKKLVNKAKNKIKKEK